MQGLEAFDNTVQKSIEWIKDVMVELKTQDRHRALLSLRAVLHTLRDRLTLEEVSELSAQLPVLIRGIYFEGWHPTGKPLKERHKEQFLSHIPGYFKNEPDINSEEVVRAVFKVIEKHVSPGEIENLRRMFPPELRELWPAMAKA